MSPVSTVRQSPHGGSVIIYTKVALVHVNTLIESSRIQSAAAGFDVFIV